MVRGTVALKQIEDVTKSQVTFSKRRTGLVKKASELSVLCDVDVAFIGFAPSGRPSHFSSQKSIEDLLLRYINLPSSKRNYPISNSECFLQLLDHINSEDDKAIFVNNQIKRLHQQIRKLRRELNIVEVNLKNYEPDPEQITTVVEALWRETFLEVSLKRIMDRKHELLKNTHFSSNKQQNFGQQMEMKRNGGIGSPFGFDPEEVNWVSIRPTSDQLLMQMDPWLQSNRPRRNSFHDRFNEALGLPVDVNIHDIARSNNFAMNNTNNNGITISPSLHEMGTSSQYLVPEVPPLHGPIQQELVGNSSLGMMPKRMMPNQEMGTFGSPFMGMVGCEAPSMVQQPPGRTFRCSTVPILPFPARNVNWQEGIQPMFNPEEVNWSPNAPINNGQNLDVPGSLNTSGISSSVYNPKFEDMGLHVDPFLRVYDLQKSNGNLTNAIGSNISLQNQDNALPAILESTPYEPVAAPILSNDHIEEMINDLLKTPEEEKDGFEDDLAFLENINLDDIDCLF